ncbi:MAG: serine/threonine-protein kinase, partial [Acidobacteriota bacterium]
MPGAMDIPERWQQIEALYRAARDLSTQDRILMLSSVSQELRGDVEALLARDAAAVDPATTLTQTMAAPVGIGTLLGPYKIEAAVGQGGMGQVFSAIDTRLGRKVAIKLSSERFSDRFGREAKAISSLNHPHICTLYDVGPNYLVMELVEGETLAACLKRGKLSIEQTLQYAQQIASALTAAHAKGIVHRDLKPANIMKSESGMKVLDFGLAKTAGDETLTVANAVMGTPAYMAPEQREGKPADARTDIYAFGCVLYEMLTGSRPSSGQRIHPPGLGKIVTRCLEPDPERRWQSVAALEQALRTPHRVRPYSTATATAAFVALILAAGGYFYYQRTPKLTDKDTIVLADFENRTGDDVFDGTRRQGLAIQLAQSPFLSLVSDQSIQKSLGLMGQPADTRLTPRIAKEVCERSGSAAVLEGSIASLGSQFVLGLRAKNCRTGDVLDEEQAQAARKEDVLNALSQIAGKFRNRIGESLASVEKHSTPLAEATTPSLEALKAFSAGDKTLTSGNAAGALPFFKRAVEIDPKFAMGYSSLGLAYGFTGDPTLSAENTGKAYGLRDRASEREKLIITATYQLQTTGNLEQAQQALELWARTYPREKTPYPLLGAMVYPTLGKYENGIEAAKKALEFDPDFPYGYLQLAFNNQFLGRTKEAEIAFQRAAARKVEFPELLLQRYDLAFLKDDKAAMEREVALAQGKPGLEDWIADREAFVLAYTGRLQEARAMSRRAINLAHPQADLREREALYYAAAALWESLFGNVSAARPAAAAALKLSKSRDVEYGSALALALSGESSQSLALANDLEKRLPEDTGVKLTYLPVIGAALALNAGEPAKAIEVLQVAAAYELGVPPCIAPGFLGPLYTVYVRGEAFLALHQGRKAALEFQKVLDHRGIVASDPIGALAHWQLGRALAMAGDKTKAIAAYQDFLKLWQDADPDIPILK